MNKQQSFVNKNLLFYIGVAVISAIVGSTTVVLLSNTLNTPSDTTSRTPVEDVEEGYQSGGHRDTVFASSIITTDFPDLTYAAENAVQAVVYIETTVAVSSRQNPYYNDPFYEFFGYPQGPSGGYEAMGGGSGVIISEDGYIATNNHVVEGATSLRVKLNDGREYDAEVIGTDHATDVALIKIEAEGLPTLQFGSSDDLRLGEWVLAIGYPMGLQSTITAGIVSAKARRIGAIDDRYSIESFIQTDAAVNPGNSGGALVNTQGELVGLNTIIKTSTGSYVGYSFAVPETIVRKVVTDLREFGVVQRAVLGITFRAIDQHFVEQLGEHTGISDIGGMYVSDVAPEGAAALAGIESGDIILKIDNIAINDTSIFLEQIGRHRPGDTVEITVRRGERERTFSATLQNQEGGTELLTRQYTNVAAELGGSLTNLTPQQSRQLRIEGGIQITEIEPGGILDRGRVKPGFIITHINERPVRSVEELSNITGRIETIDGVYPNGRTASFTIVQ